MRSKRRWQCGSEKAKQKHVVVFKISFLNIRRRRARGTSIPDVYTAMATTERLAQLRLLLKKHKITAYIIPTDDAHQVGRHSLQLMPTPSLVDPPPIRVSILLIVTSEECSSVASLDPQVGASCRASANERSLIVVSPPHHRCCRGNSRAGPAVDGWALPSAGLAAAG